MADKWIDILGRINKRKGVAPGDHVSVEDILQAMDQAGVSQEDQIKILGGFMATLDIPSETPAEPQTLTLQQVLQMFKDPAKHADLAARWKAITPAQQAALKAQIDALKPAPTKTPDVDTQKLVQPVLSAMQQVNQIATSNLPKRTKMLDVIPELNKVLPSPALALKDDKGATYAQNLINMLNTHADKFGTTATPGDKFVKLLTASIQQNKPIELPQTALESRIIALSRALNNR